MSSPSIADTIDKESTSIAGIPDPSIATSQPEYLADPGGVRSRLAEYGIQLGVNYIGEVLGNPTGGFKQSTLYNGLLEVVLEIDMEDMSGWKGLTFFANGYQIHGSSISASNLGVLMPVSFFEATPATRLYQLYFDQKLFDDKASIRVGQLAADAEFMLADGSVAFLNATWGWPSITGLDLPSGGPAYPFAAPGARLAFNPNDQLKLLVALFNGDPVGPCDGDPQVCNPHNLEFRIKDPPLLFVEGAYKYHLGAAQLPGTIKLGGWRNFGDFEAARDPDRLIHGNHGIYAVIDQMIYRLPGDGDPKGISVFGRVMGAPADRNLVDIYWEAGLTCTGMFSSRRNDIFGIGFAYTGISDDVAAHQRAEGDTIISDYEALSEISYTAEIVPGFYLQPDFQYFWNPGGRVPNPDDPTRAVPNAAVLGVRTTINY